MEFVISRQNIIDSVSPNIISKGEIKVTEDICARAL